MSEPEQLYWPLASPPWPPRWLALPHIACGSIGWRMGIGEDYSMAQYDWETRLPEDVRDLYNQMFPPPPEWRVGKDIEEFQQGGLRLPMWRPDRTPKYTRESLVASGKKHNFIYFWLHDRQLRDRLCPSVFAQWYPSEFFVGPERFSCAEQYMMAAKAALFGDMEARQKIMATKSPKDHQAIGRVVQGFDGATWDKVKYTIVVNGNWRKFSQNQEMKHFLLQTGDAVLVETSPYDHIWGIGYDANAPQAADPSKWRGENLLGFALMEVRDELRRVCRYESLCDWSCVKG